MTPAQWREDLDAMVVAITTHHANPFATLSREAFDRRVAALRDELPRLPGDADRAIALAGLAAAIGDGHTNLQVYGAFARLPLRWFWFGPELRITGVTPEHRAVLGHRVIAIGGRPTADAARRVASLVPQHESEMFVAGWTAHLLRMPDVLRATGIANVTADVAITLRGDDGHESRVTIRAVTAAADGVVRLERPYATPSLADSRPSDVFWFERVADSGVLYFNFSGYPERQTMRRTGEALAAALSTLPIRTLLVDLRANGGGDFKMGRLLIDLLKKPIADHGVTVYVAIGRDTFSAGMTNATDFKNAFGALYLGEASGARPNGYQENFGFELPHSRFKGSAAQTYYRFQEAETDGLQPDVPLPPTWDAYAAGVDPVLSWILARERR